MWWRTAPAFLLTFCTCLAMQQGSRASTDNTIQIGAILDGNTDGNTQRALELAQDYVNSLTNILPNHTLNITTRTSDDAWSTYTQVQQTCSLIQNGASVLIGPSSSSKVKVTNAVAYGLKIPQITPHATDPYLSSEITQYPMLLKMSSPDSIQSSALIDIASHYGWSRLAVIASFDDYGRNGISEFQRLAATKDLVVSTVVYFNTNENASLINVSDRLQDIKNKGVRVVLLNCVSIYAKEIIKQAAKLGMMGTGWAWLVTDGITGVPGLYDPCAEVPLHLRGLIGTRPAYGRGALYSYLDRQNSTLLLQVKTLRTFDAVLTAAYGLHNYIQDGHSLMPHDYGANVCQDTNVYPNPIGELVYKYIKEAEGNGTMNYLNFTEQGYPGYTDFEIVNLQLDEWVKIGDWFSTRADDNRLEMDDMNIAVFPGGKTLPPKDTNINMKNMTLKVVTVLEKPFIMLTTADEKNAKPGVLYKGYCIDLLNKLQEELGFQYKIHLVKDGLYGSKNKTTGEWNGMMGELIGGEADMIVAPITIDYEREQDVEFTKPYMDLGLTVLIANEMPSNNFLAFLEPFEWRLWAAVAVAFIVCGIGTTLCSFFSPYGYHGMYVQRVNKKSQKGYKDRNALRLWNSLWYSFSSWMQQGADYSPRSASGRMIHGVWWFAVMVIAATYTANLAAFLTVARLDLGINSLMELAEQDDITYGTVSDTAASKFFHDQISYPYYKMWKVMNASNNLLPNSSYAVERVRETYGRPQGRFAFIWDSSILEYESNMKPCVTRTIGHIFNQFGYGLAFRKNSPLVGTFTLGILKLRQGGSIEGLNSLWISNGACQSADQDSGQSVEGEQTSLNDMAGVFAMLLLGLGFSVIVVVCEYCVAASRDSKAAAKIGKPVSFWTALKRRLSDVFSDIKTQCRCCTGRGKRPTSDLDNNQSHEQENRLGNGHAKKMRMDNTYEPSLGFKSSAFSFNSNFASYEYDGKVQGSDVKENVMIVDGQNHLYVPHGLY